MRTGRRSRGAWRIVSRLASIAAAASWLVLAGCGGDDGEELPWVAQRAAEVRELDFLQGVDVITMTRAEYHAQAAENAAEAEEADLRELADTYGRLGYFPLDADLRPILAVSSDWVGASYSPVAKSIIVVEDEPGEATQSTRVHEYVHALQDQHFDLLAFDGFTSDGYLARRAVVEGDATLAEARFVVQDEHRAELDAWGWRPILEDYQTWGDDLLQSATYPLFLDYPSFVYPFGLEYTALNLLGPRFDAPPPHDWGREDELFTERPPATTSQVMGGLAGAEEVEAVGLVTVPGALAGRLEDGNWDMLGAWYIHLLLYGLSPFEDARALAAAWRGDRVLFVNDAERGGAVATVWGSAWDTPETASLVASALDTLYGRVPSDDPPQAGTSADGEALWIEQRDTRVVAIKNLDPALASAMAEAAFGPPSAAPARRSRPPLARRLRKLVY